MDSTKYVFLTGGGAGALGKGLASAAIGLLFKTRGLKVSIQRLDPLFNVDKRTVDAGAYGEIFVTEDGGEVSFHVGDYERFLGEPLSSDNYITAGQIYYSVIMKERRSGFNGRIVRMFPDIIEETKSRIRKLAAKEKPDIILTEIGGAVGDVEVMPFIEAARQIHGELGNGNVLFIHMVLVPYVRVSKRFEVKAACQSIRELRSWGIEAKMIISRSESWLPVDCKQELMQYSGLPEEAIIDAVDVESIYEVPQIFHRQDLERQIAQYFGIKIKEADLDEWNLFVHRMKSPLKTLPIALCGFNVQSRNTYRSLVEALCHSAVANNIKVKPQWVDCETLTDQEQLKNIMQEWCGAVLLGSAGPGIEIMMKVAEFCRIKKLPLLAVDTGLHAMLIEFARNVCKLKGADSREFNEEAKDPVVNLLLSPGRMVEGISGSAMRLGSITLNLKPHSLVSQCYSKKVATERYRSRYGMNPRYLKVLEKHGMSTCGTSQDKKFYDIFELRGHSFYVGVQFHPEYKSYPLSPHPLFYHFLKKCLKYSESPSKG